MKVLHLFLVVLHLQSVHFVDRIVVRITDDVTDIGDSGLLVDVSVVGADRTGSQFSGFRVDVGGLCGIAKRPVIAFALFEEWAGNLNEVFVGGEYLSNGVPPARMLRDAGIVVFDETVDVFQSNLLPSGLGN